MPTLKLEQRLVIGDMKALQDAFMVSLQGGLYYLRQNLRGNVSENRRSKKIQDTMYTQSLHGKISMNISYLGFVDPSPPVE